MYAGIRLVELIAILWLIMAICGCVSSPSASTVSGVPPGTIRLEQSPMTAYMRSRVGTPEELSPLAPSEARNVHKVGGQWCCEINGRAMVYNSASGQWEPQR